MLDVLILLLAALVLGAICERLRQSAIIGYLLAGTLLGPNALQVITSAEQVEALAELGVALLLFTIGLEFSWRRLRRMGAAALGGGTLQVVITASVATAAALLMGLALRPALATGVMIALSSTACVLRVLVARAEIESVHGRHALGVLLLQDLAVVPLVLLVSVLGGEGTPGQMALAVARTIALAVVLIGSFYLLFNYVVPPLLGTRLMHGNRELPILLAIVVGLGSAWTAHRLGLSPAMGAFVAGMLLAESPFATQIRADIASLRTLLMTLFFSSIGMLADPAWIAKHWVLLSAVVAAILAGKTIIVWFLLRLFRQTHFNALATGICLAQVGEFSFVLAVVARGRVIGEDLFLLIVSATIVTLFVTPYLVAGAPRLSRSVVTWLERMKLLQATQVMAPPGSPGPQGHVIIVGFGPAGQAVGHALSDRSGLVTVVDLNRRTIEEARRLGFRSHVGDASHVEVLEHLHITSASAVVVTVPDPATARSIIQLVRSLAPEAWIIARSRYHVHRWELEFAGAQVVVDEEQQVGEHLAAELRHHVRGVDNREITR